MGRDFIGAYDLLHDRLEIMDRADRNKVAETVQISGIDDPKLSQYIPEGQFAQLREELEMARSCRQSLTGEFFLNGSMTPIWFGSAPPSASKS